MTEILKYQGIQQSAEQVKWNLIAAHDAIIEKHIKQTHFANRHRREPPIYKLIPKYIGCYKVLRVDKNKSTVGLELPPELIKHQIHLTFHVKLTHSLIENNDEQFPNREVSTFYELGANDKQEWFIDEIIGHRWTNNVKIDFQVKWMLCDIIWELLHECNKLEA
ncbi:hypothetical protein M422DRAFT_181339 [Sphaerobolus stellatus SS14]|uniref:Unplaced genomic scaffold SPHSTscaffold_118, whole genome shotgun sequence n=1 Tax=Sphaerobolus stellatus (strain SS14) TaxID=990650 RepID=A0A0C9VBZ3_SPHS4|nr:hypothetical protein M422DRAFT_181339 [Sphaerobolus stellatus SS14]